MSRVKWFVFSGSLCLLCMPVFSQNLFRQNILLNGEWLTLNNADESQWPSDSAAWYTARVPDDRSNAVVSRWYKLKFFVPSEWQVTSRKSYLYFGKIVFYAKVWLNGTILGDHSGQRDPFEFDVSQVLQEGQENELMVFVHNESDPYYHPYVDYRAGVGVDETLRNTGRWVSKLPNLARIEDDVYLYFIPQISSLTDIFVTTSVRQNKITAEVTVCNQSASFRQLKVVANVNKDGVDQLYLGEWSAMLSSGEKRVFTFEKPWSNPELWGFGQYGNPVLYHLRATLYENGVVLDKKEERFGFREFWYTPGDSTFLFNGKPYWLLSTHWVNFDNMYYNDRYWWRECFKTLQHANINGVTPHGVRLTPIFYDVADEMGMLITAEFFCGGYIAQAHQDILAADPAYRTHFAQLYKKMVRLDRNHPSVVMWGTGDLMEGFNPYINPGVEWIDSMRAADTSRLFYMPHATPSGFNNFLPSVEEVNTMNGIQRNYFSDCPLANGAPSIQIMYDRFGSGMTRNLGMQIKMNPLVQRQAIQVNWPSLTGTGVHIRYKGGALSNHDYDYNWCDAAVNYLYTPLHDAYRDGYASYTGQPIGVPATERVPEVVITVKSDTQSVTNTYVYVQGLDDQTTTSEGMLTDRAGTAWFVLQSPGRYQFFTFASGKKYNQEVVLQKKSVTETRGYSHIDQITLQVCDSCPTTITPIKKKELNLINLRAAPNPFHTTVDFYLETRELSKIIIKIYRPDGTEVRAMLFPQVVQGKNRFRWMAEGLTAGIYFAKVQSGDEFRWQRLVFLK